MRASDGSKYEMDDRRLAQEAQRPVWYLSHPLTPDAMFSYEDNMAHIIKTLQIAWDAGFNVIAPYHTICLAKQSDFETMHRGLGSDLYMCSIMKRIILVGHRISSGMKRELQIVLDQKGIVIDMTAIPDSKLYNHLYDFYQQLHG